MRKELLLTFVSAMISMLAFSQADRFWSANNENRIAIPTDKAVARLSYPKEFKLFNLNAAPFRQQLFSVVLRIGFNKFIGPVSSENHGLYALWRNAQF